MFSSRAVRVFFRFAAEVAVKLLSCLRSGEVRELDFLCMKLVVGDFVFLMLSLGDACSD